jgi:hypothetical protein
LTHFINLSSANITAIELPQDSCTALDSSCDLDRGDYFPLYSGSRIPMGDFLIEALRIAIAPAVMIAAVTGVFW